MKKISYNEDRITENEIDEVIKRVKVFLINENREILFANSDGGIQLVGGHVEEGESDMDAIIREIKEETGIMLEKLNVSSPFYEIKYYKKNYNDTGKNRLSIVSYYFCNTSKQPDEKAIRLTENEKRNEFQLIYIPWDKVESCVASYLNNEKKRNVSIAKEILGAFEELKNIYCSKK